eukprot:scaffold210190_cov19-Tisochrysis_lutea.AAC.1
MAQDYMRQKTSLSCRQAMWLHPILPLLLLQANRLFWRLFCSTDLISSSNPLPLCALVQATSVGLKETEATTFLEKKIKADPAMSYDKAVQTAISALQ